MDLPFGGEGAEGQVSRWPRLSCPAALLGTQLLSPSSPSQHLQQHQSCDAQATLLLQQLLGVQQLPHPCRGLGTASTCATARAQQRSFVRIHFPAATQEIILALPTHLLLPLGTDRASPSIPRVKFTHSFGAFPAPCSQPTGDVDLLSAAL